MMKGWKSASKASKQKMRLLLRLSICMDNAPFCFLSLHPQTQLDAFDDLFCPKSLDTQPVVLSGSIADRCPHGD